jgi:hypothetical protein
MDAMTAKRNWRAVAVAACAAGIVGVLVGRGLALPNGATSSVLTYAGTLSGVDPGPQDFSFTFNKMGATCGPIRASATVDASGAFSVPVDVSGCAAGFFDGSDVTVDVNVAGVTLTGQPITPVPYAKYADRAASAGTAESVPFAGLTGKYVVTGPGGSYSVGATKFCAASAMSYTGSAVGGYVGAKKICESACNLPTAHMCASEELIRSTAIGIDIPDNLWFSTGIHAQDIAAGVNIRDCGGWQSSDTAQAGPVWKKVFPYGGRCNNAVPLSCCD